MKNIHQEKPILKAVEHLASHGKEVLICEPKNKGDFNDIAQRHGNQAQIEYAFVWRYNRSIHPCTQRD